jgi:hypothetical protein
MWRGTGVELVPGFGVSELYQHWKKRISSNNWKYILTKDLSKKSGIWSVHSGDSATRRLLRDSDSSLCDLTTHMTSLRPASRALALHCSISQIWFVFLKF